MAFDLSRSFASMAGGPEPEAWPALEPLLEEILQKAQAAWPDLHVPAPEFAERLGRSVTTAADLPAALALLCVSDLYLAAACVRGCTRAHGALERGCLDQLPRVLRRLVSESDISEVCQRVRTKLLVGEEGKVPKLDTYRGQGTLKGFVRTIAWRIAIDELRLVERAAGHTLADAPHLDDPELAYLRHHYHALFSEALRHALLCLSEEDRLLLRLRFVLGWTTGKIGQLFQLRQNSVSQRLLRCTGEIRETTRHYLRERLGVPESELDSLLRLLPSTLSLSLRGLLAQ